MRSNYAYFAIIVEDSYPVTRDELYDRLREKGIYARKYFYPLTSDQACFKNKYKKVDLHSARRLSEHILVLPFYEKLEMEKIQEIGELIKKQQRGVL